MSNARTVVAKAARAVGLAAVLSAATGSMVALAARADAAQDGMHGNPAVAAPYWRYQQQNRDCGEMAVADVVGQVTGREPTEDEITAAAGNIPSVSHPGPIYRPGANTKNSDLPVLLAHYGVLATVVHLNDSGIKAGRDEQVSAATFEAAWNTSDNFAVVTN